MSIPFIPEESPHVNLVAILFACFQSHYYKLPNLDIYDIERDAKSFSGGLPVVAHPPCRGWGRLRHFAQPRPGELDLARFAVRMVRENGGVLEHPSGSSLWFDQNLPIGKQTDGYGGYTLKVDQSHWGHKAQKSTLLYVCGCSRSYVPQMPLSFDCITGNVEKNLSKSDREKTPYQFCTWLVELASRCRV